MAWRKSTSSSTHQKSQLVLALVLAVVLLATGVASWWFFVRDPDSTEQPTPNSSITENETPANVEEEPQKLTFNAQVLQAVVDDWVAGLTGEASVVLATPEGDVIAAHNADRVYFAASIYKLYVAYEGYRQVDSGAVNPQESFLNGQTRVECLDLMIRESDSPCAEKLWVELGKEELTEKLEGYGISGTSMTAINTTAADAANMLARIARSEGLSEESQTAFLTSMREQVYRDALNKGFSSSVTVYNKIGFRELVEYHDVSIVEFDDGRKLIVSVMTERVGTSRIAALGAAIETAIAE